MLHCPLAMCSIVGDIPHSHGFYKEAEGRQQEDSFLREVVREALAHRSKTVTGIFSYRKSILGAKTKRKTSKKCSLWPFVSLCWLLTQGNHCFWLDKKMPTLKIRFYRFEKKKNVIVFSFSQGFFFFPPAHSWPVVLGQFHGPPAGPVWIPDKVAEEWKADHWVHLQRRLKKYIWFLIIYADHKPENISPVPVISLDCFPPVFVW